MLITPVVDLFHRPLPTHASFFPFISVQLRNKVCVILDVALYVEGFCMFWPNDIPTRS
jgi:hypothetical protein